MNKLALLVLVAACVAAGPTGPASPKDFNCFEQENDLFSCIFVKTASVLNRAARSSDIQIIDGVVFVRNTPMERSGKKLEQTELEIINELPRDHSDRMVKLMHMLYDAAVSFMKSHSLKLSMPEESISRALEEGRGKIKKVLLPIIAAAGIKIFALVPILLGGLSLLALKALFFGKIALLIAGIIMFQKLFSGNAVGGIFGKNPSAPNFWYDNGVNAGWAPSNQAGLQHQGYRSFAEAMMDAQNLAYAAHAPVDTHTN